jgi:DNA protecting protein DprA
MNLLHFAHHFFHFESTAWARFVAGGESPEVLARRLFSDSTLPRRTLRKGEPSNLAYALRLHEELLERERDLGVRAISEGDPDYPPALSQLPPERRPALLYLRGAPVPEEKHLVAIVGTRHPSERGMEAAHSFAAYLSSVGVRVVSGLARGIDTIAHQHSAALGTVAVLGAGVGLVYPEENQPLSEKILSLGGTLLSPFPLDQVPLPQNFPDRNELIAALAAGVIVVEGAPVSGAAITGKQALAMGKGVVALPQDFRSEYGRGAVALHRAGAELVTSEEEAVEVVFRRLGGFAGALPVPREALPRRATFSFREFHTACAKSVPEAVALLEEGILQGKIRRSGQRYRLT